MLAFDAEVVSETGPSPTFGPPDAQPTKNDVDANSTSPMQTVGQTPRAFILLRRNSSGKKSADSTMPALENLPVLEVVVTGIVPLPRSVIVYVPVGVAEDVAIVSVPTVYELGFSTQLQLAPVGRFRQENIFPDVALVNVTANVADSPVVTVAVAGVIVIGKDELLGLTKANLMLLEVPTAPGVFTLIATSA